MEIAIVTHADTDLGIRIAQDLVHLGYRVYGLGADFSKSIFKHPCFKEVPLEVTNPEALSACIASLREKPARASLLVHVIPENKPHRLQDSDTKALSLYVHRHITFQVQLTQLCLDDLVSYQGVVLFVSQESSHGVLKSSMSSMVSQAMATFASGLREDLRTQGVKVLSIKSIKSQDQQCRDTHRAIASTIEDMLRHKREKYITEIVLEEGVTLSLKEKVDHQAKQQAITLPDSHLMPAEPLICTPKPSAPLHVATHQEKHQKPKNTRKRPKRSQEKAEEAPKSEPKVRPDTNVAEEKKSAAPSKRPRRRKPRSDQKGEVLSNTQSLRQSEEVVLPANLPPKKKVRRGRPAAKQETD